jgi:hypothetical protein
MPRHTLPLPQKSRVRTSAADGIQLREQGRPNQAEGVVPLFGTKFMQHPNAVAFAASEDCLNFLPSQPFELRVADDF